MRTVTIGIDSSTTNCGVAVFINGNFETSFNESFKGTYDFEKLKVITENFKQLFSDYGPDIVLIEEPAPVRNSRAVTGLNQVAGAIFATAYLAGAHVEYVHNMTVKRVYQIKTKDDSIRTAKKLTGIGKTMTDHESDAVLLVLAYINLYGDQNEKKSRSKTN